MTFVPARRDGPGQSDGSATCTISGVAVDVTILDAGPAPARWTGSAPPPDMDGGAPATVLTGASTPETWGGAAASNRWTGAR